MKYLQSVFRAPSKLLVTVALLSLLLALPVYAQMNVVVGTGQIGDGVTLSVVMNGQGNTSGGKVHSPSGAPDLWFRAGSTPTFPGALSTYAEWGFESHGSPLPWEGAVTGTDNWMKTIRDSDGCVSWSQFEFDFTAAMWLVSIPLYVTRTDCADFTLDEAIAAVSSVQADTRTWGNLKSLYR